MTVLEAILLGLIQGLTEFLPVSSSGHLELGKALLGVELPNPLLFSIVVHGATALSTLVIFRKTIAQLLSDLLKFKWNWGTQYALWIVVSMIPVGVAGLLWEDQIELFFDGQILLVGIMLLITALLLFFTDRSKNPQQEHSWKTVFITGLAQAVAILPGISRSGATIATSILLGVKKEEAARFSFLMVLPPIVGATLLKVKALFSEEMVATEQLEPHLLIIGFLAAFIAGCFACTWMINLVKKSKLSYFAIYCALAGTLAIIFS